MTPRAMIAAARAAVPATADRWAEVPRGLAALDALSDQQLDMLALAVEAAWRDGIGVSAAALCGRVRLPYNAVKAWYRLHGLKGRAGECRASINRAIKAASLAPKRGLPLSSLLDMPPRLLAQLQQEPAERQDRIMADWQAAQVAEEMA